MSRQSTQLATLLGRLWPWLSETVGTLDWRHQPDGDTQQILWFGFAGDVVTHHLKFHLDPLAGAREKEAYRFLSRRLEPGLVDCLGHCPRQPSALLFTAPVGSVVDVMSEAAMTRAGDWLGRLHKLEFSDANRTPINEELRQDFEHYTRSNALLRDDSAWHLMSQTIDDWQGADRVYCHGRFEPAHWFHDDRGRFTVIEMSAMRPDAGEADLVGLLRFFDDKRLKDAFEAGYGSEFDDRAIRQTCTLALLRCLEEANHSPTAEDIDARDAELTDLIARLKMTAK